MPRLPSEIKHSIKVLLYSISPVCLKKFCGWLYINTWIRGNSTPIRNIYINGTITTVAPLIPLSSLYPFKRQPHKVVKHTLAILRQKPRNCLSVFDHIVRLVLKGYYQLKFLILKSFGLGTVHFYVKLETAKSIAFLSENHHPPKN